MTLDQALQKLFGTSRVYQGFGVPEHLGNTTQPHNGIDIGLNAGAPVPAVQAGRVVYDYGQLLVVQAANGIYEGYRHLNPAPGLAVGQHVSAGQNLGAIGAQTGWPYYVNGQANYSTTPHLHFADTPSLATAINDTGGVDPSQLLIAAAQSGGGGSNPNGDNTMPILGGIRASTGTIGNFFDSLFGNPPIVGPNSLTSNPGGLIESGAAGALGSLLGTDIAHTFGKYAVLTLIALVGLIVFAELLKPGTPAAVVTKAVP